MTDCPNRNKCAAYSASRRTEPDKHGFKDFKEGAFDICACSHVWQNTRFDLVKALNANVTLPSCFGELMEWAPEPRMTSAPPQVGSLKTWTDDPGPGRKWTWGDGHGVTFINAGAYSALHVHGMTGDGDGI